VFEDTLCVTDDEDTDAVGRVFCAVDGMVEDKLCVSEDVASLLEELVMVETIEDEIVGICDEVTPCTLDDSEKLILVSGTLLDAPLEKVRVTKLEVAVVGVLLLNELPEACDEIVTERTLVSEEDGGALLRVLVDMEETSDGVMLVETIEEGALISEDDGGLLLRVLVDMEETSGGVVLAEKLEEVTLASAGLEELVETGTELPDVLCSVDCEGAIDPLELVTLSESVELDTVENEGSVGDTIKLLDVELDDI